MTRAAELTSGHLGLFIADEIMKYNEIASNKSPRKAYKTAMKYGDHFYAIFAEAIGRMDEAIRKRTSIYRWADIATQALSSEVEKIKAIYRTNPKFEELLIKAATQLLEWRCPEFTPTQKRIDAILEFIFHEVPVVGSWRLPTIAGIPFHGMIYPAIHPRGMQVIAGIVSEFDNILGEGKRTLLVMHLIQGA
jgi:tRNA-dependent cyclodipeptide synthase